MQRLHLSLLLEFHRNRRLDPIGERGFNILSLLLSAGLGFGIGLLRGKIGSLPRGALLQRKCYPVAVVCHGTSCKYA